VEVWKPTYKNSGKNSSTGSNQVDNPMKRGKEDSRAFTFDAVYDSRQVLQAMNSYLLLGI